MNDDLPRLPAAFETEEMDERGRSMRPVGGDVFRLSKRHYLAGGRDCDGKVWWAEFPSSLEARAWQDELRASLQTSQDPNEAHPG